MEQYAKEICRMRAEGNKAMDDGIIMENYNRLATAADQLEIPKQLEELKTNVMEEHPKTGFKQQIE
jgi:hypothetical protein